MRSWQLCANQIRRVAPSQYYSIFYISAGPLCIAKRCKEPYLDISAVSTPRWNAHANLDWLERWLPQACRQRDGPAPHAFQKAIAVGYDVMFCFLVFFAAICCGNIPGDGFFHSNHSCIFCSPYFRIPEISPTRVAENSSSEAVPMCQASLPLVVLLVFESQVRWAALMNIPMIT